VLENELILSKQIGYAFKHQAMLLTLKHSVQCRNIKINSLIRYYIIDI